MDSSAIENSNKAEDSDYESMKVNGGPMYDM